MRQSTPSATKSCDQTPSHTGGALPPPHDPDQNLPAEFPVRPAQVRRLEAKGRPAVAYIFVGGRRQVLGPWGSLRAQVAYADYIASLKQAVAAATLDEDLPPPRSVGDLMQRFTRYAEGYYTKHGRMTGTAKTVRTVKNLIAAAGMHTLPITDLGPKWLKTFREFLAAHPKQRWSRTTINEYIATFIRGCEWAVSEEIITEDLVGRLRSVKPLGRGRGVAVANKVVYLREEEGVDPVDRRLLTISRRYLSRTLRIMLDVQLVTAMRPSEVCAMRPKDLKPTSRKDVKVYEVAMTTNKTDHHGIERRVYLGPRALRLLEMVKPPRPNQHYFSPIRAMEAHNAAKRATRQSKRWPSHAGDLRNEREHDGRQAV